VKPDLRVVIEELLDRLGFMRRQVVEHDAAFATEEIAAAMVPLVLYACKTGELANQTVCRLGIFLDGDYVRLHSERLFEPRMAAARRLVGS
jgi:hypothetical protein